MIEFGLFSSQIPYIVFIAMYLLYFGASSLNKQDKGELILKSNVSERHIAADTKYDNKTLIYRINSCIRFVAEKYTGRNEDVAEHSLTELIYIRDNILPIHFFIGNSIFSRPPPFSSWF